MIRWLRYEASRMWHRFRCATSAHKPADGVDASFDGITYWNVCEWCGSTIGLDSQGNWFRVERAARRDGK